MNSKVSVVVGGKADFGVSDLPSTSHFSRFYAHGQGGYTVRVGGEAHSSQCHVVVEVPSIPFSACRSGLHGDVCTDVFKKSLDRAYADAMKKFPIMLVSKRQRNAIYLYSNDISFKAACVEVVEQRWQVQNVLKGKTVTFTEARVGDKSCTEVSLICKHEHRGEFLSLLTQFVVEAGADISMRYDRYEIALVPYTLTSELK